MIWEREMQRGWAKQRATVKGWMQQIVKVMEPAKDSLTEPARAKARVQIEVPWAEADRPAEVPSQEAEVALVVGVVAGCLRNGNLRERIGHCTV